MEEFVANEILRVASEWNCGAVCGRYVASPKNALVSGLYERLGFERRAEGLWNLQVAGPLPRWDTPIKQD